MPIPRFHFPNGITTIEQDEKIFRTINKVKTAYEHKEYLSELQFLPVIKLCGLPEYLNLALFRKLESVSKVNLRVSFTDFIEGWANIARPCQSDESLFFNILKKPSSNWLAPEDFLPVLEDLVMNHPGLRFLSDNLMFQERYIETVICRIFYEANCISGKMKLSHFGRSGFTKMIKSLGPNVDLNNTQDCFSYKHFYVIYCKFWALDDDHNLILSAEDLLKYNDYLISTKLIDQIMLHGRIPAFTRDDIHCIPIPNDSLTLTYLDYIWFLLSEIDKSTPMAIEYWFRCMDCDEDGIITTYDLSEFWKEQQKSLFDTLDSCPEEVICFDDIIRQLNDLVQPIVPGQFRLSDLKKNKLIAERFLDTFLNVEKFQIHDSNQGLIRMTQQLEKDKRKQQQLNNPGMYSYEASEHLGPFSLGTWCDFAETEYQLLLFNERCESVATLGESGEDEAQSSDELELFNEDNNTHSTAYHVLSPKLISQHEEISEDHESDTSTPTTPIEVMSDLNEKWIPANSDMISHDSHWLWYSINN